MKISNIPPFYVGQTVICNKTSKYLKKGQKYVIDYIIKGPCCSWLVSVGIKLNPHCHVATCSKCGWSGWNPSLGEFQEFPTFLFDAVEFNKEFKSIKLTEVIEKELMFVSEN